MSTSLDEALGKAPAQEPVVSETPEAPVDAPEQPAEAAPEAQPEPEKPEQHMVPVSVVKELRDEIRSLKAAQPKPEPVPLPDVLDNPEGFAGHIQNQVQEAVRHATFNMSRAQAVREHGEDAVAEAEASLDRNSPEFNAIVNSGDPYWSLMQHVQKQQAMAEIGDDPAAFRARVIAEERAKWEAEMAAKQVKGTEAPPSLASTPNIGARSGPAWSPTSLEAALNGRR